MLSAPERQPPLFAGTAERLAYITDVFPAVTLTFVYLEIKQLYRQGMQIDLYAIWPPPPAKLPPGSESNGMRPNYLSRAPIGALLRAHAHYLRKRPRQYVQNLKLCLARHASLRLRRRTVYNFLLAPYFASLLRQQRTAHIHAQFASGAATIALMASKLLDIGFSMTAHRGDILEQGALLREKVEAAKFVIAISTYNRETLLRHAPGVERGKIKIIHCGVETQVFRPAQRGYFSVPLILSVGSLRQRKGHAYLLEACRVLRDQDVDYRCTIIGNGPERALLYDRIRKYDLVNRVVLTGNIAHEAIPEYYRKADIFVLPSLSEGIPVVLMEAMSTGLPVVATNITGVPELVSHDTNGILVAPADPQGLAAALLRLLNDADLRTRLGSNARQTILRHFDLDLNARRIKQLLEEAVTLGAA